MNGMGADAEGPIDRLRRAAEPALRRLLHLHWRFSRGLTLGVRAVVVDAAGKVFLVRHSYVSGWHLPGGGVETGETLVQALARELAEEGNITVVGTPALHGVFYNPVDSPRDHVAVFVVRVFRQDGPPRRNREIAAHGFFALDALPADTTPGTRRRLAEVLEGAPIATKW
jgi:ADP-ribose pyrophosphatase YjhB (NUDIX family)